jgi:hypothetical protein
MPATLVMCSPTGALPVKLILRTRSSAHSWLPKSASRTGDALQRQRRQACLHQQRQACLHQQLGQFQAGQGRVAGRFQDDRIAGGQGGAQLVQDQQDGIIERRDGEDNAARHAQREPELAGSTDLGIDR